MKEPDLKSMALQSLAWEAAQEWLNPTGLYELFFDISEFVLLKDENIRDLLLSGVVEVSYCDDDGTALYVNCSDVFFWGSADGKKITDEEIPALEECLKLSPEHGAVLWVARKRQCRPQGAFYAYLTDEEAALFDACGPEREIGVGNPYDNKAGDKSDYKNVL